MSLIEIRGQPGELVHGAGQRRPRLVSRSANEAVPLSNASIAVPMVSRSSDNPVTSLSRRSIAPENLAAVLGQGADHGVQVVDQLLDRLVVVGQAHSRTTSTW